jgi:hypothetical protein
MQPRPIASLTAGDFTKFPVWRFTDSDTPDETYVTPVRDLPVRNLSGCVVGTPIRLANGTDVVGILSNLDPQDPRATENFLTLSVFREDHALFHLARYHDFDASQHGPSALAAFLGLELNAVFPISYDVSQAVSGIPTVVCGVINAEPSERLSEDELMTLAVKSTKPAD